MVGFPPFSSFNYKTLTGGQQCDQTPWEQLRGCNPPDEAAAAAAAAAALLPPPAAAAAAAAATAAALLPDAAAAAAAAAAAPSPPNACIHHLGPLMSRNASCINLAIQPPAFKTGKNCELWRSVSFGDL